MDKYYSNIIKMVNKLTVLTCTVSVYMQDTTTPFEN
jgi:hypothetical protein